MNYSANTTPQKINNSIMGKPLCNGNTDFVVRLCYA